MLNCCIYVVCSADFTPLRGKMTPQDQKSATERVIPPYNGFGSDEDSLGNCLSLLPRPPKRDFTRFMELDKAGCDGHVLRFLAKLQVTSHDPNSEVNEQRRFIISYFLADGTVSVFEQSGRNFGMYPTVPLFSMISARFLSLLTCLE